MRRHVCAVRVCSGPRTEKVLRCLVVVLLPTRFSRKPPTTSSATNAPTCVVSGRGGKHAQTAPTTEQKNTTKPPGTQRGSSGMQSCHRRCDLVTEWVVGFPAGDLTNPDSPLVRDALTRTCIICKARPNQPCHNTINPNQPLPARIVHIARATGVNNEKETE